ncbi:hypothetical protein DLH72_02845 [Candidatus Gracilibacteria bacterium]|nr:MAG: hypothetical protein DLH72_02845 [Candidatus Gracilibacteria bacterium]
MKKYFIYLFLIFVLGSCASNNQDISSSTGTEEKMDFIVETVKGSDLTNIYHINKSSKIEASSEIEILTEASGRVENISVKEGDNVTKGQTLAFLYDNSANLNTNYKQAVLNLEQSRISYENNKLSLDKAITDSQMALERLKLNFENTKKSLKQDIIQAKDNLENTNLENNDSRSSLDIQKLDNSLEKMEFEYQTQLKSNKDKIDSFILMLNREKDTLRNLVVNSIDLGDSLFSIKNKNARPSYYDYIAASDSRKKDEAEYQLQKLIDIEKTFENLNLENESEINNFISKLDLGYLSLKIFLDSTLDALNASLSGLTGFTDESRNAFTARTNSYISAYQASYGSFLANKTSITGFLNTYKESEEAIAKQIELFKKDREISIKSINSGKISSQVGYEKIIISSNDTISNLELQIKNAEITLENSIKTRDITLKNLENSIKNAELMVEKSAIEVGKLVLKSPISGQVSKIDLIIGQTYPIGTKAIQIISTSKRELDVYVTSEDLEKIQIGDKVSIDYRDEKYEAEVFSKSNVANETLNYKVKVSLNKDINLVGGVANVSFQLKTKYPLISINSVVVLHSEDSKKLGELNILKDGNIEKLEVELGEVYGKFIEIKTELSPNLEIVLSDTTNFDLEKFKIKSK